MFLLSFALLFAVVTCGQIASDDISQVGRCPAVKLPKDFDWHSLEGLWFEYAKYPNKQEGEIYCISQTYEAVNDDTFTVKFSGLTSPHYHVLYLGTGKILGPGLLFVLSDGPQNGTYKILGTDHKTWAVLYNCRQDRHVYYEMAWILTRERNPMEETVREAKKLLFRYSNHPHQLINTKQDDCSLIII